MNTDRNYTRIANEQGITPQNMQHFMSNSPWSSDSVCKQVQDELKDIKEITNGGVITIDETADEKAGTNSAGAAKQYNGRMGKIKTSQVGVLLCYVNLQLIQGFWSWINGKLYLPQCWFEKENEKERNKAKVPADLKFKTKIELAWDMIEDVIKNGLPFEIAAFDTLYGRSEWLRKKFRALPGLSMANIRELLRSVMPLKNLTPLRATELIIERLEGRAKSRKSRLKNHDVAKSGM